VNAPPRGGRDGGPDGGEQAGEAGHRAGVAGRRAPAYRWLALLPTIGLLGGVPFANRVHPFVLGLPFLLFYIVAWVVATSALVGVVWSLDRANGLVPTDADDRAMHAGSSGGAR
jgi:hypothetical protein